MSKVFRVVGVVAGAVAAVASGPVGVIAAGIAIAANIGAQLTAKSPTAEGQVLGYLVGANNPLPYLIGEAYTEGVELYKVGYGGEVDDVKNPYAFLPRVLSCCGPIESMGATLVNYQSTGFSGSVGTVQPATGYFADYLYIDQQLGARPESDALASPAGWGTPTNWSSAHKLSGFAAVGWSLEWSKKGKRFAGGQIPPLGKIPKGVKVYDPRLDSTYPGGSGSHRITDESTWTYSVNPALHALTYAYGRKMNGVAICGGRIFDTSALSVAQAVAWANVCDFNGWEVHGTIYEPGRGQGHKWNNLKRICEAGAGVPVERGGVLGFDYQAPRTSLYTVTRDDLAAGAVSAKLGQKWRGRFNTLGGRYRSPDHQWNYVQAEPVSNPAWVAEDGEEKLDERQIDLVKDVDQFTELLTYDLYQRREAGPFVFVGKPHMRVFWPGDCLTLGEDLEPHPDGAIKVVVRRRKVDPQSGVVAFACMAESDAKHVAALGLLGLPPASVSWPSQQDIDEAHFQNRLPAGYTASLIRTAAFKNPRDASDVVRSLLVASETGGSVTISVARVDVDYAGEDSDVTFDVEDITTLNDGTTPIGFETLYYPYFDYDPLSPATPPAYGLAITYTAAQNSTTNPLRHALGTVVTPASGSGGSTGGDSSGIGSGYDPNKEVP